MYTQCQFTVRMNFFPDGMGSYGIPSHFGIKIYFCHIKIFREGSEKFFYPNYICRMGVGLTNFVPSHLITD